MSKAKITVAGSADEYEQLQESVRSANGDLKRKMFGSDLKGAIQRISFRHTKTLIEPSWLYVLQLNHARLPNTSATKEGDCGLVQRGWIAHPL